MITVFEDNQPTLQEAQKIVGGLVEMVHSPSEPDWQILVNEEGLLEGLAVQRRSHRIMRDRYCRTRYRFKRGCYVDVETQAILSSLEERLIC
jgi:hypothetical protein